MLPATSQIEHIAFIRYTALPNPPNKYNFVLAVTHSFTFFILNLLTFPTELCLYI